MYENELYHHGVLGMKWGERRFQNEDGSLTEAGKKRAEKRAKKREHFQKVLDQKKQDPYARLITDTWYATDGYRASVHIGKSMISQAIKNDPNYRPSKQQMQKLLRQAGNVGAATGLLFARRDQLHRMYARVRLSMLKDD